MIALNSDAINFNLDMEDLDPEDIFFSEENALLDGNENYDKELGTFGNGKCE